MTLAWTSDDLDGDIFGLNFGERGIRAKSLLNSKGLKGASSSGNGMILSVDRAGRIDWSYNLNGWNTTATVLPQGGTGSKIGSLLVTVNGETRRVFQDAKKNVGGLTPPRGSKARFRILGRSRTGDFIIRLDGKLSDFGFVAAAPAPLTAQGAEGEGPAMSDGQYRSAADEVFTQQAWA
jgi:hypothetical protein